MKQVITKISVVLLTLIVLFSTFSFTVEKHYCGDFLVDVSYLGEADGCSKSVNDGCENVIEKKKCCKDVVHQIYGQDEIQKNSLEKINFNQVIFLPDFYTSYKLLFPGFEKQFISYLYYLPPDLVFDIQVLHEVFVI